MRLELSTDEFGSIYGPHNYSVIDPQSHKLSAQVWHWNQEQTEVVHCCPCNCIVFTCALL